VDQSSGLLDMRPVTVGGRWAHIEADRPAGELAGGYLITQWPVTSSRESELL
jgi:hypothetical protein